MERWSRTARLPRHSCRPFIAHRNVTLVAIAFTTLGCLSTTAVAEAATRKHSVTAVGARGRNPGTRDKGAGSPRGGVPLDASTFEPGACVAFAPTHGDNHHTVFLDAGHGSIDPGGKGVTENGTVIYEAPSDLAITLDVTKLLRAKGFRVVASRTTSTEVARLTTTDLTGTVLSPTGVRADLAARDQCANMAGATLLVGIYLDASTTASNAGSVTAYDATRPFARQSLRFANLLQADVLAKMNSHGWQIPDGGVHTDTAMGGTPLTATAAAYHHLALLGPAVPGWYTTPSKMPGALIEPLYVSDPFEGSIAVSAAGRTAVADGIAKAVERYVERGRSSRKKA